MSEVFDVTRDIDVLKYGSSAISDIEEIFRECCNIHIEGDGLAFDPDSVEGEEIREQEAYDGIRVKVRGNLGNARITIQIDLGFGDVITPEPLWIEYPTILDEDTPRIRAYTLESSIAEKYQDMVNLDMANSRMKDFYDIYFLSEKRSFEGPDMQRAINETFSRRDTDIAKELPTAFTATFFEDDTKNKQWIAFIGKISDDQLPKELSSVVNRVKAFLWPVTRSILDQSDFTQTWEAAEGWRYTIN
ncbi:MAG: nucleotidyl transferase AbiEii/AbiGii toxin family protein [Balneolaceae bacterium]|nr:nucleotidyl transferase AbiEii/AbiGii toxin family protein [Balneolaceae bacterium]